MDLDVLRFRGGRKAISVSAPVTNRNETSPQERRRGASGPLAETSTRWEVTTPAPPDDRNQRTAPRLTADLNSTARLCQCPP